MAAKKKPNKYLAILKSLFPFIASTIIAVDPLNVSNSVKRQMVQNLALGVAGRFLGVEDPAEQPELVEAIGNESDAIHATLKPDLPR